MTIVDPKQSAAAGAALEKEWRARVDKVLKGADFEARLIAHSFDALPIGPLYPAAHVDAPRAIRARHSSWNIVQRIDHVEPASAHATALTDLAHGADGLALVGAKAPNAYGFGLKDFTVSTLEQVLGSLFAPGLSLRIEAGPEGLAATRGLLDLAARQGVSLARLDLHLGLDPIGGAAFHAKDAAALAAPLEAALALLPELEAGAFSGRVFLCDGRPAHAAGASEAQELAFVLANGVALLRAMESKGHDLEKARSWLAFALAADADLTLTLAKFRALRRLWARVEAACGLGPSTLDLHGETAWRMMTRRDPFNNVLRATTATLAAGCGGADSISILPFTQPLGLPDDFARRIARNTHLILLEEARLGWVDDPAAGSGAFENLTEALCSAAWSLFRAIEEEGGLGAALAKGSVQAAIGKTRSERGQAVARRRLPIIGTSAFPNPGELPVAVLAPVSDLDGDHAQETSLLPASRVSAPFERLYAKADELTAQLGKRPAIFLANFGSRSDFSPRAAFAQNFFAAAGFDVLENEGFESEAALIAGFAESGALAACLCSSDVLYAEQAVPLAGKLAEAGCAHLVLAGKPGQAEETYRSAGIEAFIFTGCDGLAYPTALLKEKASTLAEAI
ncbi:methylmalonyl-CoA mutase family protein [Beijerinckia indica]|uniref:Methylmalonyl-CoA mutase n=1 Tax=Beijerinckia indica subsp. indica (strain ATCC 9039 / DSM 1715 / NCIMB 8712) TaxID=395963 RepID=B2IGQ8_BEII9|nr:methylmalonyl-CoA mutase family protein [Beijerinckia indica]ACB95819.1 Methylmalonyl-CoA mutase [Beijerinckia indica subsp. indica ATCC 9039]